MSVGVYTITNLIDNKIYVGSTSGDSQNFNKRRNTHFHMLRKNKHDNRHLQSSYNKYGERNFLFEILEEHEDYNLISSIERWWINMLNTKNSNFGYNFNDPVTMNLGRKVSEETKEKIRATIRDRVYICSEETRERRRIASLGNKSHTGKTFTEEHIENLRKGSANRINGGLNIAEGHKKKIGYEAILQYDLEGNFIKEWENFRQIAKETTISAGRVSDCCKGKVTPRRKYLTAGGFKWKFKFAE